VFRRHLKVIALRFHGHGFVSGLFGCCRVSAAIALATATSVVTLPFSTPGRIRFIALIAGTVAIEIAAQGRRQ
jgi:hypothetical protein